MSETSLSASAAMGRDQRFSSITAERFTASTNPVAFQASPRPGGSLNVMVPPRELDFIARSHSTLQTSFKPKYASSAFGETQMNEDSFSEQQEDDLADENINDNSEPVNKLAVTISCVMLLAAKLPRIPEEYLTYTEYYLSSVKNETGICPPNIQQILNNIRHLRREQPSKDSDISIEAGKKCVSATCPVRSYTPSVMDEIKASSTGLNNTNT